MGRPPCCDKVGIKKGPWTPEEDIVLVSYIQEHGPGNWRAVPTNTGLLRCSKSCRLRWTNYLRPGIKRGNFTPHEEGMIVHLQALLGNKWAAIATYLPQRTDNDIKNYWNTHLKKKLKKLHQSSSSQAIIPQLPVASSDNSTYYHQFMPKNYVGENSKNSSVYASSAENISRLLEGWMRSSSPPQSNNNNINTNNIMMNDKFYSDFGKISGDASSGPLQCYRPQQIDELQGSVINTASGDELECILSFDHHHHHHHNLSSMGCEKSSCDSSHESSGLIDHHVPNKATKMDDDNPPLSFLEKWLLDESAGQVEGVMDLPPMFYSDQIQTKDGN